MNYGYTPFWNFQAPAGDVLQRITTPWFSPSLTVNYAGNPAIEERVVTQVASYGKQLGWLTEIVLALADGEDINEETKRKLRSACEQIQKIKRDMRQSAYLEASDALDRLQKEHPHSYRELMERRRAV
ncbi:hypothetical protein [Noviherbaspirillum malthae]|jgi:hypothetical protein|uniref:hypothetical protein n=1 Tax=Noviherbaspirillum malthae TaxID=1260987 RepID=UPI00189092E6|nr:hypothetical protein [Noviherbaspirillum malthae]